MSYGTIVTLLKDIDLKPDYQHTFKFADLASQVGFFINNVPKTVVEYDEGLSYIRVNEPFRVDALKDNIIKANYLTIKNADGTIMYGFINRIDYISERASTINWTLDIMQTYQFNMKFEQQFIEREHVASDNKGEHLIEENLETGEIVDKNFYQVTDLNELLIVIATTLDSTGASVPPEPVSGIYSALGYYAFDNDINGRVLVSTFIDDLNTLGKIDAIQALFMMPKALVANYVEGQRIGDISVLTFQVAKPYINIDGYVPKNNKLFIYPYNYLYATNYAGRNAIYKYEYSDAPTERIDFTIAGDININPTIKMYPNTYKGLPIQPDEAIIIDDYPQCSFLNDNYKNWLAQNRVSNSLGGVTALSALAIGVISGGVIPALVGAGKVAQIIGQFDKARLVPPQARGNVGGSVNITLGLQGFTFQEKQVSAQFAKIIDDYFSRYGYKINRLKTLVLNSRQNWNYIKLQDANINGNIPQDDLREINNIFNNGVTFWHNDVIGQYNLSNNII